MLGSSWVPKQLAASQEGLSSVSKHTQSVGPLGRGISPSQGRYLHTELHKHRINHTHIHACSGIRIHYPSVRAGEDGSCLGQRDNCDRRLKHAYCKYDRTHNTQPSLFPCFEGLFNDLVLITEVRQHGMRYVDSGCSERWAICRGGTTHWEVW
jgi:hypothetical protein